jgi:PIN domain nuclease of toxin-antitoxin system
VVAHVGAQAHRPRPSIDHPGQRSVCERGLVDLVEQVVKNGFIPLLITPAHAIAAAELPLHHRDPFDRMLVAQASLESLTLLTADPRLKLYGVRILLA